MLTLKSGRRGTARKKPARITGKSLTPPDFIELYRADPMERVGVIRRGVSPAALILTSAAMQLPQRRVYDMLRLPVSTTKRKTALEKPFSPEQSERILGLQRLIGQVEAMLAESGDGTRAFDAPAWVARWLETPVPALGNERPGTLMDTVAGQEIVSNLLARMQSGAYA